MSAISPLLAIEQERRFDTSMAWIGVLDEITERWLWLHEVRPNATWRKRPTGYKLRHITKAFISDRYLIGLAAIVATRNPPSDAEDALIRPRSGPAALPG
ncbi:hypothetical protein [Actinoplanes sp. NPDC051851]|uniref:hypothetical protein n=1 Tax=Actinoplanes sp. NPDC051851 TaxID=3154753 RepID=UPI00344A8C37